MRFPPERRAVVDRGTAGVGAAAEADDRVRLGRCFSIAVNEDYLKVRFNRTHDRPESEFFYPRTDAGPFLERGILTIGFTTEIHDRYHLPAERPRIDQPLPRTVPRRP